LSISLVAIEEGGALVGHIAFSPVRIAGVQGGWFGLAPLSVSPQHQRRGIGTRLVRAGLDRLKTTGALGAVVLGEPAYYGVFGFRAKPDLRYGSAPPGYFAVLGFGAPLPSGTVEYHRVFGEAP
ncbi:MAG: N-acetyltransferase, partial [Alphaproteobacteria bacterium]|nr:N-acetyltransferase [Alphaproteobacteria bacterium]